MMSCFSFYSELSSEVCLNYVSLAHSPWVLCSVPYIHLLFLLCLTLPTVKCSLGCLYLCLHWQYHTSILIPNTPWICLYKDISLEFVCICMWLSVFMCVGVYVIYINVWIRVHYIYVIVHVCVSTCAHVCQCVCTFLCASKYPYIYPEVLNFCWINEFYMCTELDYELVNSNISP